MNATPIHEVSINYTHLNQKRRKRNGRIYTKTICVRAPSSEASHSRASRIFIKLHPNTNIHSMDDVSYPGTCSHDSSLDTQKITTFDKVVTALRRYLYATTL